MHFITLAYNHQNYILYHLESIRWQTEVMPSTTHALTIIDDCSSDKTLLYVKEWLNTYGGIFDEFNIVHRKKNVGVVENFVTALSIAEHEKRFKILAGDDLYGDTPISIVPIDAFDIVQTPCIDFSSNNVETPGLGRRIGDYLKYSKDNGWDNDAVTKRLRYSNPLAAPGIFLSCEIAADKGLRKYLSRYRNIEDLPSWHYLFNIRDGDVQFGSIEQHLVLYRTGSGVTSSSYSTPGRLNYLNEEHMAIEETCPYHDNKLASIVRQLHRVQKALYLPQILLGLGALGSFDEKLKLDISRAQQYLKLLNKRVDIFATEHPRIVTQSQ